MATLGDLVVHLNVNGQQFHAGLKKSQTHLQKFAGNVKNLGVSLLKIGATGAAGLAGIGVAAVKLAADAEQTSIAFEVMTGNVELAKGLIKELRSMAGSTPFEFTDLSKSAKILMQYGRASNIVLKDVDMLGNIASGNAEKLHLISLAYGQISANGRLMGQDLLQLINAGFNPLQEISAKTGETMIQLRDRMSKGLIPFEEVRQAFVAATSEGGRFYQMNEKQSKTLLGRWSALKDEITLGMIEVGESIMKNMDLKGAIAEVSKFAGSIKNDLIPAIGKLMKAIPDLAKVLNEGILGKKAGDQLEKIAFIISAIRAGMGPQEAGEAFQAMKRAEREAPLNDELNDMMGNFKASAVKIRESAEQFPVIQRAESLGNEFVANQMGQGIDRRSAVEIFGKTLKESAEKSGKELPKFLREWFEEFKAKQFKIVEGQEAAQQAKSTMMAEKAMAGWIRDGLDSLRSGVMSLGPPKEPEERLSHRTRTLEANSAEAFEVLRANVGQQDKDIPKKQLKEAEKTNKLLEKWAKSNDPHLQMNALFIKGLD